MKISFIRETDNTTGELLKIQDETALLFSQVWDGE
jgi:hypothetical protein